MKKGLWVWLVVGGLLVAVFAWVVLRLQARSNELTRLATNPPVSIFIQNPLNHSQFEIGNPVLVTAKASGPSPVVSMELLVDGSPTSLLTSPGPEGLFAFRGDFWLDSLSLGSHYVFVRITIPGYQVKVSAPLFIEIVESNQVSPEENDAAYQTIGTSVPAGLITQTQAGQIPYFGEPDEEGKPVVPLPISLPETNPEPPLPPEDPDLDVDPMKPFSPGLNELLALNSPELSILPPAPILNGYIIQESCNAYLHIKVPEATDTLLLNASEPPDTDGFFVKRMGPGQSSFSLTAQLDNQLQVGGNGFYLDGPVYGEYYYFVSAFNEHGQTTSNIIGLINYQEQCKPATFDSVIALNIASLFDATEHSNSYCYYSSDGQNWFRHPAEPQTFFNGNLQDSFVGLDNGSGFIQPPLPEPEDPNSTPTPITVVLQEPETEQLMLQTGGEQLLLGTPESVVPFLPSPPTGMDDFNPALPPSNSNLLLLASTGPGGAQSLDLDIDCWEWDGESPKQIGSWVLNDVFASNFEGAEFTSLSSLLPMPDQSGLSQFLTPSIKSYQVPIPVVSLGSGPEGCADHAGTNFVFILVCADIADDLDYVVWDLGPCLSNLCYQPSKVVAYNVYDSAQKYWGGGGEVQFFSAPAESVDAPLTIFFLMDELACEPRDVYVTSVVEDNGVLIESLASAPIYYPGNPNCEYLFGVEPRQYRITLDGMDFSGGVNDDPDTSDDVEAYGSAVFYTESGETIIDGSWGTYFTDIAVWTLLDLDKSDGEDGAIVINDEADQNPYPWIAYRKPCEGYTYCFLPYIDFSLYIGEWGRLEVSLKDKDGDFDYKEPGSPDDDTICEPTPFYFSTYMVDAAPEQVFYGSMTASHADATCVITFHIEVIDE